MSGHSKWSTIKRKKGVLDAKRGKVFTKIAREIMAAARIGGPDPAANARLRTALLAARAANMPRENQERAVKKGAGDLEATAFEEVIYEGRGPAGTAFVLEVMTDNKNRTVAEIRNLFAKAGGEMGPNGSATYMFTRKGVFAIPREKVDEDRLMEIVMEAGGDDVQDEGDVWVVLCEPTMFAAVSSALEPYEPANAAISWLSKPESAKQFAGEQAVTIATLWAKLDDLDDVQTVYCSAELPDEILEEHGP